MLTPTNQPGGHGGSKEFWPLPQGLSLALMATGQYLGGTPPIIKSSTNKQFLAKSDSLELK